MAIWFVLISEAVKGQQPDEDNPFVPYIMAQASMEWVGRKVIPPDSDLDHDLVIGGSVCPFVLNMEYELKTFEAECEDVDLSNERIIIPHGCRFTFQLEGKEKARIEHEKCPVLLIFQEGWLDGV